MIIRETFAKILERLLEKRRFIQVLAGPRQVGKTTLIQQVLEKVSIPFHYASADQPTLQGVTWLEEQWELARRKLKQPADEALLVLDEVHKITHWSEVVKRLWDEDAFHRRELKVVLLGSSPILLQKGLTESLAGRFELIPIPHWSFQEMRDGFGWDLDRFLFFGGYPGAAPLIGTEERWSRYIHEALIETTLSRDILLLTRVEKPALLRRLFHLGCEYSGQILSYQKIVGQLQEAGNTTTVAHYLDLLSSCWLVSGLQKFAGQRHRQRSSSPKLQVWNTALLVAAAGRNFASIREDGDAWGRVVESAIGAHLLNSSRGSRVEVFYWREGGREVDFVLKEGDRVVGIEVKSGRRRETLPGMGAFSERFGPVRKLLVGMGGIPPEEFLTIPAGEWLKK